ncbi:MAG: YafY family transcriptional regulator [Clostridia bacterium]|nr:YafY family transcriptional regulator [Clostridia bacterium]
MKFERLLDVLFELLSKKSVTAKYLAEKLDVSVRSVYRYIECLEAAGVPLYTTRGQNGGFHIVDTYRLSSTFMTTEEFDNVINSLTAIADGVPDKTLTRAINKLKSTVKNEYSGFDVKSGNLIIDGGPWGDTVGYKAKLSVIEKSLSENRELAIRYHDRNGKISERIIHPHVIVFKQGLWYVYAYCCLRKEFRFFKTGRIENAYILNSTFERKDLSKMDLPLDFWHNAVKAETVVLEIDTKVLSDVEEWLGIENVKQENDKFVANVSLPFDQGLVSKIMSYGNGVKVISPSALKESVRSTALRIADLYTGDD